MKLADSACLASVCLVSELDGLVIRTVYEVGIVFVAANQNCVTFDAIKLINHSADFVSPNHIYSPLLIVQKEFVSLTELFGWSAWITQGSG